MNNPSDLTNKLLEIAKQQGHYGDKDFKPEKRNSNLQILSDFYLPPDRFLLEKHPDIVRGPHRAICRCICGKEFEADYKAAKRGFITSCGCLKRTQARRITDARAIEKARATPKGHKDWTKAGENRDGIFGYLKFIGWTRVMPRRSLTNNPKSYIVWNALCICGAQVPIIAKDFPNRRALCCDSPTCQRLYFSNFSRYKAKQTLNHIRGTGQVESLVHTRKTGSPE